MHATCLLDVQRVGVRVLLCRDDLACTHAESPHPTALQAPGTRANRRGCRDARRPRARCDPRELQVPPSPGGTTTERQHKRDPKNGVCEGDRGKKGSHSLRGLGLGLLGPVVSQGDNTVENLHAKPSVTTQHGPVCAERCDLFGKRSAKTDQGVGLGVLGVLAEVAHALELDVRGVEHLEHRRLHRALHDLQTETESCQHSSGSGSARECVLPCMVSGVGGKAFRPGESSR
eukprot:1000214-Rhodomonas_salina.2